MWEKWEQPYSDPLFYILMASTYMWMSIHQFIKQHQHLKIKESHINSYQITITFFIWPRGALEIMFEVEHLVHLKVGG